MKESTKRMMGFLSILPLFTFIVGLIYFLVVHKTLINHEEFQQHEKLVTITVHNYTGLTVMGTIFGIISAAVLLYFSIHLARVAHLNASVKLGWMVFMLVFSIVAFPIFWWMEIRSEPEDLPLYTSIE